MNYYKNIFLLHTLLICTSLIGMFEDHDFCLKTACHNKDLANVRQLIQKGNKATENYLVLPNTPDAQTINELCLKNLSQSTHNAIDNDNIYILRIDQLLLKSVKDCNLTAVQVLLKMGADSNTVDDNLTPILHIACQKDNIEITKELLTNKANVNAVNRYGETALFCAINKTNSFIESSLLHLLVEWGIDVNKLDNHDRVALEHACFEGNIKTVAFLVRNNAKANEFCLTITRSPFTANAQQIREYIRFAGFLPHVEQKYNRNGAIITTLYFVLCNYAATHYIDHLEHFLDISYLPGHLIQFVAGMFS